MRRPGYAFLYATLTSAIIIACGDARDTVVQQLDDDAHEGDALVEAVPLPPEDAPAK